MKIGQEQVLMGPMLPCAFLAAAVLVLAAPLARVVTFADGQLHMIDAAKGFPLENAIVYDGPGGLKTTFTLVEGGVIGSQFQIDDFRGFGFWAWCHRRHYRRVVEVGDTSIAHFTGNPTRYAVLDVRPWIWESNSALDAPIQRT